jgi:hypothetical protein
VPEPKALCFQPHLLADRAPGCSLETTDAARLLHLGGIEQGASLSSPHGNSACGARRRQKLEAPGEPSLYPGASLPCSSRLFLVFAIGTTSGVRNAPGAHIGEVRRRLRATVCPDSPIRALRTTLPRIPTHRRTDSTHARCARIEDAQTLLAGCRNEDDFLETPMPPSQPAGRTADP